VRGARPGAVGARPARRHPQRAAGAGGRTPLGARARGAASGVSLATISAERPRPRGRTDTGPFPRATPPHLAQPHPRRPASSPAHPPPRRVSNPHILLHLR
jgi:hypothetical protein